MTYALHKRCTCVGAVVADKVDVHIVAANYPYLAKLEVRASGNGFFRTRALQPWKKDGHSGCACPFVILLKQDTQAL